MVFLTGPPLKVLSTNKFIWARLGVSRTIYVNVDSSNLGFPNQLKKTPCMMMSMMMRMMMRMRLVMMVMRLIMPGIVFLSLEMK